MVRLPFVNKESITDSRQSINGYWKGQENVSKKTKTLTESFGNISSKLLIQCCVVCCPHMVIMIYLSVMIQKYFAVAMQNNIIIRFYTVSVCGPPSPCLDARLTTVKKLADIVPKISGRCSHLTQAWIEPSVWNQEERQNFFSSLRNHLAIFTIVRGNSLCEENCGVSRLFLLKHLVHQHTNFKNNLIHTAYEINRRV